MSRRSLPILLVLLAVIATGVVWLLQTGELPASPSSEAAAESGERKEDGQTEAGSVVPAAPALAATDTPAATSPSDIESASPTAAREAIDEKEEGIDMSETWTVEGRVQLPVGTPLDEHVQVIASVGGVRRNQEHSRSDLGPDGSFRVEFSKGVSKGRLLLQSRYVFLAISHEVSPESLAKLAGPIVLRPELGGCIRGRVALARNAIEHRDALVGTNLDLGGVSPTANDWSDRLERDAKLGKDLEFEFGGLPASRVYDLYYRSRVVVDAQLDDLEIQPGRVLEVELPVQLGVQVSGRVVDEKGSPVEGVDVAIQIERARGSSRSNGEHATKADGLFSAAGIEPGKLTLVFTKTGFSALEKEIGDVLDGDVRPGLEAILLRGNSVTGRVVWPDGRPAAEARIDYRFAREEGGPTYRYFQMQDDSVTAGPDGAFEISGLESTSVSLTALAEPAEEDSSASVAGAEGASASKDAAGASASKAGAASGAGAASASSSGAASGPKAEAEAAPAVAPGKAAVAAKLGLGGSAKKKDLSNAWKAHLEDVAPGTRDLVLTLQKGATLRGRAVDDEEKPLAAFRVRAEPVDGSQEWERKRRAVTASGKDGAFELEGLHDGEWDLVAEAKQHAESASRRIRIPGAQEELVLVLPRAATISGTVVGHDGGKVADARASVRSEDAASRYSWNTDDLTDRCDPDGRFEVENVKPGPVRVFATADGMAASAPFMVELAPGQKVEGVELALRRPGRITGEVVDEQGRPMSGRPVDINGPQERLFRDVKTDAAGRFAFEGLSPGNYWVSSRASEEELERLKEEGEDDATVWAKHQKQATVDVVEGETSHVVLGAPPKDGIRVHGTVFAGKGKERTVANCTLWIHRQKGGGTPTPVTGTSDGSGKYEVVLPGTGEYGFSAMNQKNGTTWSSRFTVPEDAKELEHDIVMPGGRIAGRVIGVDGKPAPRVQVSCTPEQATAALSKSASYGHGMADEKGAFSFDGLQAGSYRFEAGVQEWQNLPGIEGKCVRTNVQLEEDGVIADLELKLRPQCRVEGVVLGLDGKPVAGATIYSRDETGGVTQRWPPTVADASGRFSMDGLLPGKTTFVARARRMVSAETGPVTLTPDETTKVELQLKTGTWLRVIVRGDDDKTVGAYTTIADLAGRDLSMMYAMNYGEIPHEGEGPREGQVIGPVPPGRYRLTATNHDRVSASEDVTVPGGEEELVITIRLGG